MGVDGAQGDDDVVAPYFIEQLLPRHPNRAAREQLKLAFEGSAMDLIDRFFPDPVKHRTLRALLAFAAIQSTYKGPYTPGSAFCLVYTLALNGDGGLMRRVKGGMGSLAEALQRSIEAKGSEVRLKTSVKRILVENGRAVGIELANGEQLRARAILSNLDRPATFLHLLGEEYLPGEYVAGIRKIEQRGAWVHLLFKLDGLPEYAGEWSPLNRNRYARFGGAMVPDPDEMQASHDACLRGELPQHVPVAFQIPSIMDPSLAPPGHHIASAYGFFFPCEAPLRSAESCATRWPSASSTGSASTCRISAHASWRKPFSHRITLLRCTALRMGISRTG